jgi:pimeloyl-ACP methyl ester carboxylesterase
MWPIPIPGNVRSVKGGIQNDPKSGFQYSGSAETGSARSWEFDMPEVRSNGARIYYEVRGRSGPPLVLIRGFASSIRSWNGVDHDLAADHFAVVLDNRGIGRSSSPSGTYSVTGMAEDVLAVLDDAGLDSAHVMGTSLGGMIAQEVALRSPQRVRSLTLAATTPGKKRGMALRPKAVLAIAAGALLPAPLRSRLTALATLSPEARRSRPSLVEYRTGILRRNPTPLRGLVGQAFAIFGHRAVDRLTAIRVPTLVIHGDADKLIAHENAERLVELIPLARLESWSGVGHDLATEAPSRLAESVRRHVQDAAHRAHVVSRSQCAAQSHQCDSHSVG